MSLLLSMAVVMAAAALGHGELLRHTIWIHSGVLTSYPFLLLLPLPSPPPLAFSSLSLSLPLLPSPPIPDPFPISIAASTTRSKSTVFLGRMVDKKQLLKRIATVQGDDVCVGMKSANSGYRFKTATEGVIFDKCADGRDCHRLVDCKRSKNKLCLEVCSTCVIVDQHMCWPCAVAITVDLHEAFTK